MPLTKKHFRTALLAVAAVAIFWALPAGGATAAWTVKGGGFGHGVGMGMYGAYGMAKEGHSYKKITGHYYKGTKVSKLRTARKVRVLLKIDPGVVRFSGARKACGVDLTESRTYGAQLVGSRIRLVRSNGNRLANCGRKLKTENDGKVVFGGLGRYRGGVEVVPTENPRGSLNVINAVPVNAYVKGVMANEAIPSWPMEVLKVQAVISRSFALASVLDGNGFDLYPDTRSQVYTGIEAETKRTNRAASQTSSQVVTYKKKVALTMFSASSGGRTESIENVFFGDPVPYLKSVKDPWDKDTSPYHRWSYDFSNSAISGALGVKGRLKRVKITKTGDSRRVIWARLYGTGGVTKIRGDSLQYNLGLPDRLIFSIKKGSARSASVSATPEPGIPRVGTSGYSGSGVSLPSTVPRTAPATTSEG